MSSNAPETPVRKAGSREWVGLAVLALPTLLISLDQSVLYLALPHLAEGLRPTGTQTLWIMDVYGFLIAGFLITMGTLGDRIGRRKLLMIGATAVGLTSVAAAYSTSAEALIVTRGLLGIAAATLMPSTLALISNMFHDPYQRARAIAVWASCFMGGTALGPVIGGMMLEFFWWGSVFLLGVPVMVLLLVVAPFLLPEYKDADAGRIDLLSAVLSLVSILSVIYGLKELARHGFETVPLLAVAGGLAVGAVFVSRQNKLADPLLDLKLFKVAAFRAALLILTVSMLGTGGGYLFITGFLQMVEGLSPMEAGLWMVPAAVASIVAAQAAPVIAKRHPLSTVVGVALLIGMAGCLMLVFVDPVGGIPLLVAGFVVIFIGVGTFGSLGTNLVIGSVPPERGGSAAALSSISGDLGNALGIAVLGSLGTAVYRDALVVPDGIPRAAADAAEGSMEDAVTAARDLPAGPADGLLTAAAEAYTRGLNTIRAALLDDTDPSVRRAASLWVVHEDEERTAELVEAYAGDWQLSEVMERGRLGPDLAERLLAGGTWLAHLARNPTLPAALASRLAHHEDPSVRLAVSARPELSEEERAAIGWEIGPEDRLDTLRWVWDARADQEVRRRCATSAHPWLRRSAAVCRELPEDCVELLAGDEDFAVRLLLAERHPKAPAELLLDLYLHGTHRAVGMLVGKPRFPAAGLATRFGEAADPRARALAVRDPEATPALLERLSRDPEADVRAVAARDARLPVARVVELLADPDVASAAAGNPALPVAEMTALLDAAGVPE